MPWKPCKGRSKVEKPQTASSDTAAALRSRMTPSLNEKVKAADENKPEFDKSARNYEMLFKPWLKIAGASREYFARSRLNWLSHLLRGQEITPKRVMDFGCGT